MRRAHALAAVATVTMAYLPSCVLYAAEGAPVELFLEARLPEAAADAALHVVDARLQACPAAEARWLGPSVARAHGGGGVEGLDAPLHVRLTETPALVGRLTTPAGRYCALAVELGPPEDSGTFELDGEAVVARARWEVPLDAPLVIDADHPWAAVHLVLDLSAASPADEHDRALATFRALPAHLRAWAER